MEVRETRDADKKKAEQSEKDYREMEAEIHLELAESPMPNLNKVDLGEPWGKVSFSPQETPYARILDADKALEYFEGRAMVDEVSQPKFVKQRLNEIVRELDENNQSMPPGLDITKRRYVRITRPK